MPTSSANLAIEDPEGREKLRRSLESLDTADLLALGARLSRYTERLVLYLEVLRGRPGQRAQLAACLICFDLARQGHETALRDFFALIPTLHALAEEPGLASELIGDDEHLTGLWKDCQSAIAADDPRESDSLDASAEILGEIDLVSDLDVDIDLVQLLDDSRQEEYGRAFAAIVARKLGYDVENGVVPVTTGLGVGTSKEIDELEAFLRDAALFAESVPLARGLTSLGQLYLAVHLRRHRLFGQANPRRMEALRAGLLALPKEDPAPLAAAASLFQEEGAAVATRFQKVTELLLDYISFCSEYHLDPLGPTAVERYVSADRPVTPTLLAQQGEPRRR